MPIESMSKAVQADNSQDISSASVLLGSLCACIIFFLYIHLLEIAFSSLAHKYRIISPKVFSFTLLYLALGLLVGLALGVAAAALNKITKRKEGLRELFSPGALIVTGLFLCYVVVIFNAFYQSESSLLSSRSLPANAAIAISSIPLILVLSRFGRLNGERAFSARLASVSVSAAAVLSSLHACIGSQFEAGRLGPAMAGTSIYVYILIALLALVVENNLLTWFFSKNGHRELNKAWGKWAVAKALVPITYISIIVFTGHARPLKVEHPVDSAMPPERSANILLIVMDTVRQDRLSVYGCERNTCPKIAKFANDALVFDAYSPSHWTLPSHASLFTGLYPTENGTQSNLCGRLDEANETLAEILVGSGYRTGAVVANNAVLSLDSGFPQGFNYYFTDMGDLLPPFNFWMGYLVRKFRPDSRLFLAEQTMTAAAVNKRALKWLKEKSDRPFFLFLNYMDAHALYLPPTPYDKMWSDQGYLLNRFHPQRKFVKYRDEVIADSRQVTDEEYSYLLGQYDGAISYMDEQIGRLFEELKKIGLYDNTLIIVTSDHGEFFGEHGLMAHPGSLYQEIVHVPLIVKPPAGADTATEDPVGPVSLVNLFHSVLNMVRIQHQTGRGEADIFRGETTMVMAECHLDGNLSERLGKDLYCLIDGNLKLIVTSSGTEEIFNIENDPGELHTLEETVLPEYSQPIAGMRNLLREKIKELDRRALIPVKLDDERQKRIRERLKVLGYIE